MPIIFKNFNSKEEDIKHEKYCIIKHCYNKRYNGRLFCEKHWKERRDKEDYKRGNDEW